MQKVTREWKEPKKNMEQKLSEYQSKQCIKALDTLCSMSISKMFERPVDPKLDKCPNYYQKIKQPMDLSTVRNKVLDNKYSNVDEFKKDVALIWANAIKYNKKGSTVAHLAEQLELVFEKEAEFITGNDNEDWERKAKQITQKLDIKRPVAPEKQELNDIKNIIAKEHPPINDHEKEILATDLNKLKKEWKIREVLTLIDMCEPGVVKNGQIDTDISKFKQKTLGCLRALLDSFSKK